MAGQIPPARGRLLAIAGAGAVLLAIAAFTGLRRDGVDADDVATARLALGAAGCTLELVSAVPNQADHSDVDDPGASVAAWNTDPPTSGPHFRETAVYGTYDEPLEQARVVHNLEHGAVFIQYGSNVAATEIDAIGRFYEAHRPGTLVAPYPRLKDKIALGAWIAGAGRGQGVLGLCRRFDEEAYGAFLDVFQFKGNERFSIDSMQPGSN